MLAVRASSAAVSGLVSPSPLRPRLCQPQRLTSSGARPATLGHTDSVTPRCYRAPTAVAAGGGGRGGGNGGSSAVDSSSLVPRRCTLEELTFSDDGRLLSRSDSSAPGAATAAAAAPAARSSHIVDLFWAAVEASAQVKDLETLTGRISMVAFFVAIGVEVLTGSGIFSSLDQQGLQGGLGLGLLTALGGGAFAVALRGKRSVADALSANCQGLVDSTVDSLVDSLFYEEQFLPHQSPSASNRD